MWSRHSRRSESDQALGVRILPRAEWRAHRFLDAHPGHTTAKRVAVDRVTIPQEPSRCRVVRERLNDLLDSPGGGRVVGDRVMDDAPAVVGEQHEDEEDAARNRRDREEVHRDESGHVIGQGRAPSLSGWAAAPPEQSRDRALGNIQAELAQFAMNPWCAPERIDRGHLLDEHPDRCIDGRASRFSP